MPHAAGAIYNGDVTKLSCLFGISRFCYFGLRDIHRRQRRFCYAAPNKYISVRLGARNRVIRANNRPMDDSGTGGIMLNTLSLRCRQLRGTGGIMLNTLSLRCRQLHTAIVLVVLYSPSQGLTCSLGSSLAVGDRRRLLLQDRPPRFYGIQFL